MKGELVIITIERGLIDRARSLGPDSPRAEAARDELIEAVLAAAPVGLKALLGGNFGLDGAPLPKMSLLTMSTERHDLEFQERAASRLQGYCEATYPFCVPEGTSFDEDHYVCNLVADHRGGCEWVLPVKRAKTPGSIVMVLR